MSSKFKIDLKNNIPHIEGKLKITLKNNKIDPIDDKLKITSESNQCDMKEKVHDDKKVYHDDKKVYHGEIKCQLQKKKPIGPCDNWAYYILNGKYACGVHSQKYPNERQILLVNPNKEENQKLILKEHQKICDINAINNKANNIIGHIICYKMLMMKNVSLKNTYVNIFPNFKHGGRKDGIGMPSLSPMSIGPINHGQPGLPMALNLENFHQGNKVFSCETNEKGDILSCFYDTRLKMYLDPIPHRHKETSKNVNVPLYSIWITKDSKEKKMTYIQSRQFYCHFYEQMVNQLDDFKKLEMMVANGYNIQICGYDGYVISKSLMLHYLDNKFPFGHELVLYCMLQKIYPWRDHKTEDF